MKFLPLLGSSLSGSIGGITASRNRGGAYLRSRVNPVQPNSPEQTAVKGHFGSLSTSWRTELSEAERDAWDVYASNTPLDDAIGQSFLPTGLNMFQRGNGPLLQAVEARVDAGPVTFGLPAVTLPTVISASSATQDISVGFDNADDWAATDNGFMFIYISRPQSESINFFKGPYRLAGQIDGDLATPPTSPATISVPFVISDNQKLFVRFSVVDAEGRKSQDFFAEVIVTSG